MIALTSEQDKAQLKEYALELLNEYKFEGLIILIDVLKDTDFKIKDREICLRWAAQKGHLNVIKHLVEQDVNIHVNDYLLRDYALRLAAIEGHLNIVKYLVEHGADIHSHCDDALRWSAKNGHLEVVKYLIEHGADVKSLDDGVLLCAKHNGHMEVVEYLKEVLKNDSTHQ